MRRLTLPLLVLALAACGTAQDSPARTPTSSGASATVAEHAAGIPDTRIGLSGASVFDVVAPPAVTSTEPDPGGNALIPRPNAESPPAIPHTIAEMLPITREENLCVECHGAPGTASVGKPMSASHFTDLRNAPGVLRESVAGARWYCTSCHVKETDARPLVRNPR